MDAWIESSFQESRVTSFSWSESGIDAAADEDVSTYRFTLGSLFAAFSTFTAPSTAVGMTLAGSGSKDTTDATCTTADTSVC